VKTSSTPSPDWRAARSEIAMGTGGEGGTGSPGAPQPVRRSAKIEIRKSKRATPGGLRFELTKFTGTGAPFCRVSYFELRIL